MSRQIFALQQRFAEIDPDLISPQQIQQIMTQGASDLKDAPFDHLPAALNLCRQNPALGTAYGLGALEAARQRARKRAQKRAQQADSAAWLVVGMGLAWWGYYDEALRHLRKATKGSTSSPFAALVLEWHRLICRRRFEAIPDVFDRLLEIAGQLDALGYPHQAMQCRLDATSSVELSERPAATLDQVRRYFAECGHAGDEGVALLIRAYRDMADGHLAEARALINQAEERFTELSMPALLSYAWLLKGMTYYTLRDSGEARRWLHLAQQRAEGLQQAYYLTTILTALATLQWEEGDLPGCLHTHQRVRQLAGGLRMQYLKADSDLTSGHILLRQGKYRASAARYQRAQRVFRALGHEVLAHICQSNLAEIARRQGNLGKSLHLFHETIDFYEKNEIKAYDVLAASYYNLALTYGAFGYIEPAKQQLILAIKLLEAKGLWGQMVRAATHLARLLAETGEFQEAHRTLDLADAHISEAQQYDRAISLQIRGTTYRLEGKGEDACAAFQSSLAILERVGLREAAWESRLGLAETYQLLGNEAAARELLSGLDKRRLPAGLKWQRDILRGKRAAAHNRPKQALSAYLSALRGMRDSRRTLEHEAQMEPFVLRLQPLYEEAFDLAISLGDTLAGLTLAELHGSQLLSARLGHPVPAIGGSEQQIEALCRQLTERLASGWTILRYAWHRDDVWVFTIRPSGVEAVKADMDPTAHADLIACTRPDISFRQFAYLGEARLQDNAAERSITLRQRLMDKLIPERVRKNDHPDHTLIIIPANRLHGLAFQALLDDDTPLIDKHVVMYAPSLDLIRVAREDGGNPPDDRRGLVCAQWEFEQAHYGPLPYAQLEAEDVCGGAALVEVRTGEHFSRAALHQAARRGDLAAYEWLHFATHAYYDPATGAFTGLLAGPEIIGLEDIRAWRLRAKAVTLSACQTGRGKWHYGDEIAGLAQAFLGAGAQTVIASQWLVHDRHTGQLMRDLYEQMRTGASPAAALAAAQRAAHRRGVAAYYWAPFCAFGYGL